MDNEPGDRAADCGSRMEPTAVAVRAGGEWVIIHRCLGCGALRENRIAGDDNVMVLMAVAARPLAHPPVPIEYFAR
jgi:hypothetical protein